MTTPRLSALRTGAVVAALVAALAACGSSEDLAAEPAGRASTEAGDRIEGDGYSYTAPAGWEAATGDSATRADTLVRSADPVDEFLTNVNTLITPAPGMDQLDSGSVPLAQIRRQLARSTRNLTNVLPAPLEDVGLDGFPAIGQEVDRFVSEGRSLMLIQYFVVRDEQSYVITVTGSVADAGTADAAMQTVLSSWTWH